MLSDVRIIPARAGFTRPLVSRCPPVQDHPRSRGVYVFPTPRAPTTMGSSPLARGLRRFYSRSIVLLGDHPRSRGVYAAGDVVVGQVGGSSPLARGLPYADRRTAGTLVGSSPLARGLRRKRAPLSPVQGIIPARAGFTPQYHTLGRPPRDHPRSRGVYRLRTRMREIMPGSSPLARGLPALQSDSPPETRIIPARAGFTYHALNIMVTAADHPRSRGVYSLTRYRPLYNEGSSPLARGLPHTPQ